MVVVESGRPDGVDRMAGADLLVTTCVIPSSGMEILFIRENGFWSASGATGCVCLFVRFSAIIGWHLARGEGGSSLVQ